MSEKLQTRRGLEFEAVCGVDAVIGQNPGGAQAGNEQAGPAAVQPGIVVFVQVLQIRGELPRALIVFPADLGQPGHPPKSYSSLGGNILGNTFSSRGIKNLSFPAANVR